MKELQGILASLDTLERDSRASLDIRARPPLLASRAIPEPVALPVSAGTLASARLVSLDTVEQLVREHLASLVILERKVRVALAVILGPVVILVRQVTRALAGTQVLERQVSLDTVERLVQERLASLDIREPPRPPASLDTPEFPGTRA